MTLDLDVFRQHLIYEAKANVESICQDIEKIAQFDREAETEVEKFTKYATRFGIGIFGFFLLMFISIFLQIGALIFIGIIGLIASILGVVWMSIQSSKFKKIDLANYRYQILGKVSRMLARDMTGDSQLFARLILSPPTDKSKLVQTLPHPYQSGFKIDFFQEYWLNMRGFLVDNSHFELSIEESTQNKYGWKRNARGKSKYKSKSKCKGVNVSLTLSYPTKKYGAISLLKQEMLSAYKLPPKVSLKRLKHSSKSITAIASLPADLATDENYLYQTITMLFLSSYQVLNLARVLSKKSV